MKNTKTIEKDNKPFSITEKANKTSLIIMIVAAIITSANAYFNVGFKEGFTMTFITVPCILLVYLLIKLTKKDSKVCAYAIPFLLLAASIFYIYGCGGCTQAITLLTICCVVASLYFDTKVILTINTSVLITTYILQITIPNGILGPNLDTGSFITFSVFQLTTLVILVFSAKWGNQIINLSKENLKEAEESNIKIASTLKTIDSTSSVLTNSIKHLNESVDTTIKETNSITNSINEINLSIESQGKNVDSIVEMIDNASKKTDDTLNISTKLEDISNKMNQSTTENMNRMNNTFEQMRLIKDVISTTSITAQDLQSTMSNISSVLDGIKSISEQTNLLALNASIEAARAGEHGKGFAVVASEVSALAAESSNLANSIDIYLKELISKTNEVTIQAKNGQVAAKKGEEILDISLKSFKEMNSNYTTMNNFISDEFTNIQDINNMFKDIANNIHSISSITEDQIIKTNKILDSQTNAENQIETILNSVNNISIQCDTLTELTK